MATLKDVAKLACVDISTVSRALNNTGYVHPDTKKRVYAAAKELGYHPNVMAQALRQGKRHTIGVIVPSFFLSVFAEIVMGINQEAQRQNYAVLLCNSSDDPAIEKECLNRLRGGFIDGLIIGSTGRNTHLIQDIQASGTPVVQVIREQVPRMNSIVGDYKATGYDAVQYLYQLGSRNIGFLGGNNKIMPFRDRYVGYQRAIQELGLPEFTIPSSFVGHSFEHGYREAQALLFQYPQLDAIITSVDSQGLGVLRLLKEQKKRVPEDVRVMSLTGHTIGALLETSMTAMEIPAVEMGASAVTMLLEELNAPEDMHPSPKRLVFQAELIEREST